MQLTSAKSNSMLKIGNKVCFAIFFFLLCFLFICNKKFDDSNFCESIYMNDDALYSTSDKYSEVQREYNYDYNKLFKCFDLNASRFFDIPLVSIVRYERSIFQSVAQHIYSDYSIKNLESKNVKCGDIIFLESNYIKLFKEKFHPEIKYPYILITHEGDFSVGEQWQLEFLNDSKIIMWYTQNIVGIHPKLKPIPVGVIPPHNEKSSVLLDLAQKPIPFNKRTTLLYLNFRLDTNKNRSMLNEYFKNTFKHFSNVIIEETRSDWHTYLSKIGNSKFVLSPPGNGLDCHRTWESLALGSIPIVLNNSLLPLYDGLPVMVVNDWTEVTEFNMDKFYQRILKNFNIDGVAWKPKFWLRYWISTIMNNKRNFVKKRCL